MAKDTYVKTIKFDADTTAVLNEIAKLNVAVSDASKKFSKGFFSPELKKGLSDFRDGLLDAFNIVESDKVSQLKDKLKGLLSDKSELMAMQGNLESQMKGKEGTDEWNRLNNALASVTDKLEKVNSELADTKDDIAIQKERDAKESAGLFGKAVGKKIVKIFEDIGSKIKKFFTDMLKEALKRAAEIASYDLQNSIKFNQNAIDLATQYGLTGSNAYSVQKTAEQMGYGSVDTLIENLWNMNDEQKAEFNKLQKMYANSYEQDKEVSEQYQKFMQEWNDFKQGFQTELLTWFSNNKEEISSVLTLGMDFMKTVLTLLATIADAFSSGVERSDSQRTAATNDIINSYRTASTNNVTVSNTFNVSGSKLESNAELQKAGSDIYRQIINAFN